MKYCLAKDGKAVEGDTGSELVTQITEFKIDYEEGSLYIDYKNIGLDTITYSQEFSKHEMYNEAVKRILSILQEDGWRLYRADF